MKIQTIVPVLLLLAFAGCGPRHHTATVTILIVQRIYESSKGEMESSCIRAAINVNTHSNIMQSHGLLDDVANRLRSAKLEATILAPYIESDPAANLVSILEEHRSVETRSGELTLVLNYRHPNPQIAVKVANAFADAFIEYQIQINTNASEQAIEELSQRAEQQLAVISVREAAIEELLHQNDLNEVKFDAIEAEQRNELQRLNHHEKTAANGDSASIQSAIDEKELELIELSKLRVKLNSLNRDLEVQKSFYDALKKREQLEREYLTNGIQPEAVIIERAILD